MTHGAEMKMGCGKVQKLASWFVALLLPASFVACAGDLTNPGDFSGSNNGSTGGSSGGSNGGGSGGNSGGTSGGGTSGSGSSCTAIPGGVAGVPNFILTTCGFSPCHGGAVPAGPGLDMSSLTNISMLTTHQSMEEPMYEIVDPTGNPANSFMYIKLSESMPPGGGVQMPSTGPLSAAQIACFADWIMTQMGPAGAGTSGAGAGGTSGTPAGTSGTSGGGVGTSGTVGGSGAGESGTGVGTSGMVGGSGAGGGTTGMPGGTTGMPGGTTGMPGGTTGMAGGGMSGMAAGGGTTFTSLYTTIIMPKCVTCHSTGGGKAAVNMGTTQASAYTALQGMGAGACAGKGALVVPNSAATSLLYEKVSMTTPPCGAQMPKGGMLTTAQIAEFEAWINAGAMNN